MKNMKAIACVCFVLVAAIWPLAQSVDAQTSDDAHRFNGSLPDGTNIEVVYVPANGKLGLITKNVSGEPTSAYLFFEVENASGKFQRTAAHAFGKVDDELFVYFELSALTGSSINIKVDGEPSESSLTGQAPVATESLRPFGSCRNYCYPSDPNHYNWYLCFWCCATTGRSPC